MSNYRYHLVSLEDDQFQSGYTPELISKALGEADLEDLCCEVEFLDRYGVKPTKMPDLFILDLMVEWQKAWIKTNRPYDPALPEDRAGIRCLEQIRTYAPDVPVIICTVVSINNLEEREMRMFDERKTFLRVKREFIDPRLIELIQRVAKHVR